MAIMDNSKIIEEKYAEAVAGIKEEWFDTMSTEWYHYGTELPIHLRVTYLVTIFHNQIFNGGFHQYFVNGYGQFAKETIDALKTLGAFKKAALLSDALKIVNIENSSDEVFRKQLLNKEIKPLFFKDDLFEPLEMLDNIYHTHDEDLELLLGKYLRSHQIEGL